MTCPSASLSVIPLIIDCFQPAHLRYKCRKASKDYKKEVKVIQTSFTLES